jgi:hypothetical protein
MQRVPLLILFLLCLRAGSQTYVVSGRISDATGPLPFATIMVKGNQFAASSNVNGYYSLRLPPGNYELIFQYVGYTKKTSKVELTGDLKLDIILQADGVSLQEVEVRAGEDPAYPIIRQAVKKRPFYLHEVLSYSCRSYIKGLQRIDRLPGNISKLAKMDGRDAADTSEIKGVVYLSEAQTQYYYQKPAEKEIMYSSKVSGNNNSFSFNQLSDIKTNFYENLVYLSDLSDRPLISPLNSNTFFFHRFFLLGAEQGDEHKIFKIKVVPKRNNDPCFKGVIYIEDSTWRITAVDFLLTKEARINFVDTIVLKQSYAPVGSAGTWMLSNIHLSFVFSVLGFHGSGYFNANISNYELSPDLPPGFYNNEILKVEDGANKKDSAYWASQRSVPLTEEEAADYREKDSIAAVKGTNRYKDSLDNKNNRWHFRDLLLGYNYENTRKKFELSLPGIITTGVQYNTVEGLNLSCRVQLLKKYEDSRNHRFSIATRYGFANKLWGGQLSYRYLFEPKTFSAVTVRLRSIVEQFNRSEPIAEIINTSYSLFYNENFMKLFKETGGAAGYESEIINGIMMKAGLSYMQRDPLINRSAVAWIDDPEKYFTPNEIPIPGDALNFLSHRALIAELGLNIRFKQKYYSLPDQKIAAHNKYPKLNLNFKKAIPAAGAAADFDLVSAAVSDNLRFGLAGELSYRVGGGTFLSRRRLFAMDYRHFNGNQTFIATGDPVNSFRLLPYYDLSSRDWFGEVHAEHHFNGFLTNYIPLLQKLKLSEVVGFHALSNEREKYYYEINFGIEKIFKVIRVDYTVARGESQVFRSGFTAGLSLSF